MKKYLTAISLQPPQSLHEVTYHSDESEFLRSERPTRYPITIAIENSVAAGETIQIVAILTDGAEFITSNYDLFRAEIQALAAEKQFQFEILEVHTAYNERIQTQLKLFADIIEHIGDGEDLYACITYGTKPIPIIISMALNYGYKATRDTGVKCIIYGMLDHARNRLPCIYDVTALFFMGSIVEKLAAARAPNPKALLQKMLALGEPDEGEGERLE